MLVVIGPSWLNDRRIHDHEDLYREEIRTALGHIVPILVNGASVPRKDDLPDDIRPLIRRRAYVVGPRGKTRELKGPVLRGDLRGVGRSTDLHQHSRDGFVRREVDDAARERRGAR